MIDIKVLRENPEAVKEKSRRNFRIRNFLS
jgi:hypothetical protein